MFLSWQLNDVWCGWVRGMHHGNVYKSILNQILTGLNSEPHQATRRIDKSWSKNHWLKKVSSFWTQILFKCNRNVSISQADKTWYSVCTHIICNNNFTCLSVVRVHVSGLPEEVGERRPLSPSPDTRASEFIWEDKSVHPMQWKLNQANSEFVGNWVAIESQRIKQYYYHFLKKNH